MSLCTVVSVVFKAEDGIRDDLVTGVQTCALPICRSRARRRTRRERARGGTSCGGVQSGPVERIDREGDCNRRAGGSGGAGLWVVGRGPHLSAVGDTPSLHSGFTPGMSPLV